MHEHSPRHRHFVAIPLAMALCGVITAFSSVTSASLLPAAGASGEQDQHVAIGTSALHANGLLTSDIGFGAKVSLLRGSAMLIRDAVSSTIVPLDVPLLVFVHDQRYVVVPGFQLRMLQDGSVHRYSVPQEWLREQTPSVSTDASSDAFSRILGGNESITEVALQEVFTIADAMQPSVSSLFALRLARETGRMNDAASALALSRLVSDVALCKELVTAIPALAGATLRPLPTGFVDLWSRCALPEASRDAASVSSLLHSYSTLPSRLEAAGYPKQAILWTDAFRAMSTVLASLLPTDETQTAISSSASASAAPSLQKVVLPSDAIDSAKAFLLSRGLLFTAATVLRIDDDVLGCVRVEHVFLPNERQSAEYSFSLCTDDRMIRRIRLGDKPLPNDVPFSVFFR